MSIASQNIFRMATHTMMTRSQSKEDKSRVRRTLENANILPMVTSLSELRAMSLPLHPQISDKGKVSFNEGGTQDQKDDDEDIRKYLTPTLQLSEKVQDLANLDDLSEPENMDKQDEIGLNISNVTYE